ncbi:MAG: bifunctional alpha,alpha-trehalose-phosphate synthase (UDP-forming)/trehalose-phosphatase [Flavobacteriaceae bacterium]|nr:bifunctional alpha,alpha-trehalose-phosphate synthase (UDP-forming)/trehalose-phosphatase [Flavobacteriaceae bacterium]
MNKTIIVSNRLPLQVEIDENQIKTTPSVGGLATGLKSVHREGNGVWIGWSGLVEEDIPKALAEEVQQAIKKQKCVGVKLNQKDVDRYYYGFSNRALWPLFHYFIDYTEFRKKTWKRYIEVNQKFANEVIKNADEGDEVWVHDYQLMLVPTMVKKKRPDLSIGFFLHIPFPSYEIFRTFPVRKEILEGLMGADLIGFHTYDYERHFLSSVRRILNLDVQFNEIRTSNRLIKVDSFPMGIDYTKFEAAALQHQEDSKTNKSEIQKRLDQHLSSPGTKMILSIDRMDYTKGIPNRIRAFEYFLKKYPQYQEKVRLIMLAVPSRSKVPQYQRLKKETDELVGRINGEFSTVSWTPIWYFYRSMPFDNLIDLYTSSDVALITPVRDGMNLVAKEYIATRTNEDGVLVLSEMTGASKELDEALQINPFSLEEMAKNIHSALSMKKKEQKRRMKVLRKRVARYTVEKWAEDFMNSLQHGKKQLSERINAQLIDEETLVKFKSIILDQSKTKVLFLDYDGTLVSFKNNPEDAQPDAQLLNLIKQLAAIQNTLVVVISGRDQKTLNAWLGHLPVSLVSDHGVYYKPKDGEWEMTEALKTEWMENVLPVLEKFVDRTPGSLVEVKKYSLAWHYRKVDAELAQKRLIEIKTVLNSFITNTDLTLLDGHKVIEIKSSKVSKGRASTQIQNQFNFDELFCFGDDWTDEFMFEDLPEKTHSVKVGLQKTKANYYVHSPEEVRRILKYFIS